MVDAPQVVLIGGAPGAGKTTLAEAAAAAFGWRWLPGDALVTAMRGVASAETHPDLHLSPRGTHVEYFTEGPPEKLVADAIALQGAAWKGFEHVVRFHARYGPSVVIDSWTFTPEHVAAMGLTNVFGFWIFIDLDVLAVREEPPPDFVETSTNPAQRRANFMRRSAWCNHHMEAEARRLGLPVLYQDGSQTVTDHVSAIRSSLDGRSR